MVPNAPYAWLNGRIVAWRDANLHIHTQCVMRGLNVFEGIRAYWNDDDRELYMFKVPEHMARLADSAKVIRIGLSYDLRALERASARLLRECKFKEDVHVRIVVFVGESADTFGLDPATTQTGAYIFALGRPQRKETEVGISVAVSSWERISDQSLPPRVKAGANYINGRFAEAQAKIDGYDSAILLNHEGKVTELPGSCLILVRRGRLVSPLVTDGTLESITRDTVLELARKELGITVEERPVDRTELYVADEILTCGTSEEIVPIVSVDRYPIRNGRRGPITESLQNIYSNVVRGRDKTYRQLLRPVYGKLGEPSTRVTK